MIPRHEQCRNARPNAIRRNAAIRLVAGAVVSCGLLVAADGSHADEPVSARILLNDGSWRSGVLESIDGDGWRVSGSRIPNDEVIAFETTARSGLLDGSLPSGAAVIELDDGQLLPGLLKISLGKATWDHRWIGAIPVDFDRIALIRFTGRRTPERSPSGDRILLANGDLLEGFVASLGHDLEFEPLGTTTADGADTGTGSGARKVPIERVSAIAFAAAEAAGSGAPLLTTADGSRVRGGNIRFSADGGWSFMLADPLLSSVRPTDTGDNIAASIVRGFIHPDRVHPLSSLGDPVASVPEGQFHYGITQGARATRSIDRRGLVSPIAIDGPVSLRYDLSRLEADTTGDRLFTAEVSLAEPVPDDARVEFMVAVGRDRSERIVLDARNPRQTVVVRGAADAPILEIAVLDGGNGIVGDSIVLDGACIITGR